MYTPSGPREAILLETVDTLLDGRRTRVTLPDLPVALQPESLDEVFWVQDTLMKSFGEIGGYKVGAGDATATPLFAPMPRAWMGPSGTTIAASQHRFRGLEAEVAFLLGEDLPPRNTPYTPAEVYAAVASAHPAIEILESGLTDPVAATRNSMLADLQMHGGFIYGPACAEWSSLNWDKLDFAHESVTLTVDGVIRVERTGSNTAGDLTRLLPWLANEGAARTGGLKAGQWITTGSWTGYTLAEGGSAAAAHFATVGRAAFALRITELSAQLLRITPRAPASWICIVRSSANWVSISRSLLRTSVINTLRTTKPTNIPIKPKSPTRAPQCKPTATSRPLLF